MDLDVKLMDNLVEFIAKMKKASDSYLDLIHAPYVLYVLNI